MNIYAVIDLPTGEAVRAFTSLTAALGYVRGRVRDQLYVQVGWPTPAAIDHARRIIPWSGPQSVDASGALKVIRPLRPDALGGKRRVSLYD